MVDPTESIATVWAALGDRLAPGGVTDAVVESVRCRRSRHLIDRGGVAQRVGSPTAQPERVGKVRASLHVMMRASASMTSPAMSRLSPESGTILT
jgi:hypothetical protein